MLIYHDLWIEPQDGEGAPCLMIAMQRSPELAAGSFVTNISGLGRVVFDYCTTIASQAIYQARRQDLADAASLSELHPEQLVWSILLEESGSTRSDAASLFAGRRNATPRRSTVA
jgi:hypothetical protein